MRFREWVKDLLWSGLLQRWWFGISVPVAIIASFYSQVPAWIRSAPPVAVVLGLLVSNLQAYSRACDRIDDLEKRLSGLGVDILEVVAGEHVYPFETPHSGPAHHSLVIQFRLRLRNYDGQVATTVSLSNCTIDVPSAQLGSLNFAGDPKTMEQPGQYRDVGPGITREVIVTANFGLPVSNTHIAADGVSGNISISDTRTKSYINAYSAVLIKNPVQGN